MTAATTLVTAVLCAAFDDRSDAAVLAVRDRVAAAGVRLAVRPRHRPHLTLAAVRVHPAQLPGVVDLAREVAAGHPPLELALDRVGTFTRAGALWLGPAASDDLRTLQRSAHAAAAGSVWPLAFGGRTDPDAWVPHCSLATRLDPGTLERVRGVVADGHRPVAVTVAGLAVIVVGGAGDTGFAPLSGPRHRPADAGLAAPTTRSGSTGRRRP